MPVARFQTPDGRIARFEMPEGTSPEQAQQMVANYMAQNAAPKPERQPFNPASQDWGPLNSILNGFTFGTLPNIQAAGAAVGDEIADALGFGDDKTIGEHYDAALKEAQGQRADFRAEHPYIDAAGNLAGGLATGAGAAKAGLSLVGRAIQAGKGILPTIGAGIVEGAGYGALSGFGNAEGGVENRLAAVPGPAAVGAALGGAAVPVTRAASELGGLVKNIRGALTKPEEQAMRVLAHNAARDRITPADAAAKIAEANAAGTPMGYSDAMGRNTQRVGAIVAKTPSRGREELTRAFAARQGEQGSRVEDAMNRVFGVGRNVQAGEDAIKASMRAKAAPLYEEAYGLPTPESEAYFRLANDPAILEAMPGAKRLAGLERRPLTDLFETRPNPNPTVTMGENGIPVVTNETVELPTYRGWDYIRRALGDKIDAAFGGDASAGKSVGNVLKEARNALRTQLVADNPKYAEALKSWADDSTALDAIELGRNLARGPNPDEALAAFRNLTPEQQELARRGYARGILAQTDSKTTNAPDFTLPFNSQRNKNIIDVIVSDEASKRAFFNRLADEKAMLSNMRTQLGGSSTAENMNDMGFDPTSVLAAGVTGRTRTALGRLLDPLVNLGRYGITERVANSLAPKMLSNDPQFLEALQRVFLEAKARPSMPNPAAGIAGANQARRSALER